MVSQLPVFSGKRVGKRVPPEMVLPVFVLVVLFFALLISLSVVGADRSARVCYLACLPLGWLSYREYQRKDADAAAAQVRRGSPMHRRSTSRHRPAGGGRPTRPDSSQLKARGPTPPDRIDMPRATRVVTAAERKDPPVVDTLILPYAQRQAQKGFRVRRQRHLRRARFRRSRCGCAPTTRWCSTTAGWSRSWPSPSR